MLGKGEELGEGLLHPPGSVGDPALMQLVQSYRRRVTAAYRSVKPNEVLSGISGGPFFVSPKVDGELWFLILECNFACLINGSGRAISGKIPMLWELTDLTVNISDRVIIAGELFAASASRSRPRVGDVAAALSGGASAAVDRLGFMAFDLIKGLLPEPSETLPYGKRLEAISTLLDGKKRIKPIHSDYITSIQDLPALYTDIVEGGKAEGLIIRSSSGMIYKVKPEFSIDAVIIGFTRRSEDTESIRSLLFGLTREDGRMQVASACGTLGADHERRELAARLIPLICKSNFRYASGSGEVYTFVRPEVVAEIKVTDLQTETSDGKPIHSMVLEHEDAEGWCPVTQMPSASWIHPVLVRIRGDKVPGTVDTRFGQILHRCYIDKTTESTTHVSLPKSQIVTRRIWTKETKGKLSIRKLLVWKTNKDLIDSSFPTYVIHWTDYSSSRSTPLEREVRTAPTSELAQLVSELMILENIKKGWEELLMNSDRAAR